MTQGSPLDLLSNISGISKAKMKEIFEEVKANAKKLDECVGPHEFWVVDEATPPLKSEYVCKRCGGRLRAQEHYWYEKGLEHGKRSCTD